MGVEKAFRKFIKQKTYKGRSQLSIRSKFRNLEKHSEFIIRAKAFRREKDLFSKLKNKHSCQKLCKYVFQNANFQKRNDFKKQYGSLRIKNSILSEKLTSSIFLNFRQSKQSFEKSNYLKIYKFHIDFNEYFKISFS